MIVVSVTSSADWNLHPFKRALTLESGEVVEAQRYHSSSDGLVHCHVGSSNCQMLEINAFMT
jgi:hypothetical protein